MISSGSLQVRPDTIIFRDLEPDESDTVDIWARNIGKKPIFIRFSLPKNPFFVLNAKANINTAPGLEAHATIKYTASTLEKETCELKVTCNDSTVLIPIVAIPPTPAVQLATNLIDFGNVTLNNGQVRSFKFTNYGTVEGKFSIRVPDTSSIRITPVFGLIESNQTQEIQVTFKAETPGQFSCQIFLEVDNNSEPISPIIATAKVVDQSLTLHNPKGEEFGELSFQHLFYGQKKVIPLILRNRGSCTRTFSILPLRSDNSNDGKPLPIFGISPMNGTVKAYSDVTINVTFNPRKSDTLNESEQHYSSTATILIPEIAQEINFGIVGSAVSLLYDISAVDFDFGRCTIDMKHGQTTTSKTGNSCLKHQTFSIKNCSLYLPINFVIKQVSQFHFNPASLTLKPNESREITVTFQPINLGMYNIKTHVSFCGGIDRREINLMGVVASSDIDEKTYQRPDVWDTVKDVDFYKDKPTTKYGLTMKELQQKQLQRKSFDSYITDSAEKRAEKQIVKNARRQATLQATKLLNDKDNHFTEDDFEEYVTAHIQQSTGDAEDPISLGIAHCEGMTPPEPPMPKVWKPFKLPESIGLFSTINPRSKRGRSTDIFDDKVLIEKKFKPKPTTQSEINECAKKLQTNQQILVIASHQTINFGNVSVFSVEKRSFQITNNLQQCILVSLKCEDDELKESGPSSQVVPPHQTCGFDIVVHYDKPESFAKSFEYTINNDLTYSVNVTAEIVPIDIVVEPEVLNFSFADDSIVQPYVKEYVKLKNNSNSTAEFKLSGFDKIFTTHNLKGTIVPHGTFSSEVTYRPDFNSHHEATATIKVVGGITQKLRMIGDTGKPKLQLAKKAISFGLISLNSPETQEFKIKNVGSDDAIFTVTPNLTDALTIIPNGGRIKANDSLDLHITVNSQKSGSFEIPITINVCGSQPQSFTISGQADVPNIKLQIGNLDFGKIYIGNTSSRKVTITNSGMIPAIAFFDLSNLPDFHIEFSPELSEVGPNENKNSIIMVTDSDAKERFLQGEKSTDKTEDKVSEPGFVYKMQIIEKSALNFSLVFHPHSVSKFSFDFPLTIMNIDQEAKDELVRKMVAESIQAPLYPSEEFIDFGLTPVFDASNPNSRSPLKQLLLKNEYNSDIQFRFDDKKIKSFKIEPTSGTIKYGSNATIFITFKATQRQAYFSVLPLYATTDKGEILTAEIQLMGVGSTITYKPSVPCVTLPPVPLGIPSHMKIDIINVSYTTTELKVDMPINEKQFPLSVTFPEGNEMKSATRELPVEFSFVSSKPMSFSTICAFVDSKGYSTSVQVSCITDNSLFTLYPILSQKNYMFTSAQGKPIIAKMLSDDIKTDIIGKFLSIDNYLKFDKKELNDFPSSKMTCDFLVKFLNKLVLSTKIKRFPDDFISSGGELIIEMISNLCGSKKPNNLSNVLHTSSTDKNKDSLQYTNMKSLLNFLISNGAMLPEIRPEFLLNQTEFGNVMHKKITRQLLGIDFYGADEMSSFDQKSLNEYLSSSSFSSIMIRHLKAADLFYKKISTESWTRVILQVLRLFMLSKLQPERILQIEGVQDALALIKTSVDEDTFTEINRSNKNVNSSNFLSSTESMILKWITIQYCYKNTKSVDIVIDYNRLHDPKFFLTLLKNHVLNQEIKILKGSDEEINDKNRETIINIMNEFKIPCIPTMKEIKEGNEIIMLLLSYQLIEILPHFLPLTTVEFNTPLSKQCVQSITITNPSKQTITYEAKIEGSPNFRALENSIQLGPNETAEFLVEYVARKLEKEKAVLSLIPGKPKNDESNKISEPKQEKPQTSMSRRNVNSRKSKKASEPLVFSSTIVINLVSIVNYETPLKTIEVETNIYETKKMSIQIENALQSPCKMKLVNRIFNSADSVNQIEKLINNPSEEVSYPESKSLYETTIQKHQSFIFEQNKINFKSEDSVESIDFEFTPISLGTTHCYVLFYSEDCGQFVYEIIGKANLPQPTPYSVNLKTEFGNKVIDRIPIENVNKNLLNAIAYVNTRLLSFKQNMTESKFNQMVEINVEELSKLSMNTQTNSLFDVEITSSFFKVPETLQLKKSLLIDHQQQQQQQQNSEKEVLVKKSILNDEINKNEVGNLLPVLFTPEKPGEYQAKIILKSEYDVRVLQIKAIGLAACKTMSVEMQTSSGKQVMQGIPFFNPSDTVWHFKATISDGTKGLFTFPPQFVIQPNSVFDFPVSFQSGNIGSYSTELNIVNIDKEAKYKYNVTAEVVDPSAEDKLMFEMKARKKFYYDLPVRPFIESGTVEVTSTIPLLTFPSTVSFSNGKLVEPFQISGFSVESGQTVGTITFTDQVSKSYIWYVIEVTVDPPEPEEVIEVKTVARKTVTLKIPVHNPNNKEIVFDVNFTEEDFNGQKKMILKPYETSIYQLTFCPLTQMKRKSEISFYNEDEGEYIYSIDINVSPPDVCIMAPVQAPIGQSTSGFVQLENPSENPVHFTITNDNKGSFFVIPPNESKSDEFEVMPHEKCQVEVRFIPTSVGNKETAMIAFKSKEIGDWFYKFVGVGKPPQPSSPIIVESMNALSSTGQIVFSNPFREPTRYEISIMSEALDVFKILNKRNTFTLNGYKEQHQIAFSFTPNKTGQFTGMVLLTTVGRKPEIRWTFPIIGNTVRSGEQSLVPLNGYSHETIVQRYKFKLIGEREIFMVEDYRIDVEVSDLCSYIRNCLAIQPLSISNVDETNDKLMLVAFNFEPRRPLQTTIQVLITNPNGQCWRFPIKVNVEPGKVDKEIIMESPIGQTKHQRLFIEEAIPNTVEFQAYFVQGSSSEFEVYPEEGILEQSIKHTNELPIDLIFTPSTYGKLMHAILIVDTIESQYVFNIRGKVPDYMSPPQPHMGTINSTIRESLLKSLGALNNNNTVTPPLTHQSRSPRKRNFIRDNIEQARIQKLPTIVRAKTPFRH